MGPLLRACPTHRANRTEKRREGFLAVHHGDFGNSNHGQPSMACPTHRAPRVLNNQSEK